MAIQRESPNFLYFCKIWDVGGYVACNQALGNTGYEQLIAFPGIWPSTMVLIYWWPVLSQLIDRIIFHHHRVTAIVLACLSCYKNKTSSKPMWPDAPLYVCFSPTLCASVIQYSRIIYEAFVLIYLFFFLLWAKHSPLGLHVNQLTSSDKITANIR